MKKYIIAVLLCITSGVYGQQIVLENDLVQRTLSFDGKVWRTIKFFNKIDNHLLVLKSDEFYFTIPKNPVLQTCAQCSAYSPIPAKTIGIEIYKK